MTFMQSACVKHSPSPITEWWITVMFTGRFIKETDFGGLAPHSFLEIILGQESDSDNERKTVALTNMPRQVHCLITS